MEDEKNPVERLIGGHAATLIVFTIIANYILFHSTAIHEYSMEPSSSSSLANDFRKVSIGIRWVVRVLYGSAYRFYWDNGFSKASALAYTSLLSLVPLMALAFGILASFAVSEAYVPDVRRFIFNQFVPNQQVVDKVLVYLGSFSEAISSLNVVVIGVLAITSLLLINSIEYVLNETWQVYEPRAIAHKIAIFSAMLLLGPALLVSSFYFIRFQFEPLLYTMPFSSTVTRVYSVLLPFVIDYLAFVGLYYLVPHAAVRFVSAAFGAFWAALLFSFAKSGFALYLQEFSSYDKIYQTLATIPIAMFWLYLAWSIVLYGAEVSYQFQYLPRSGQILRRPVLSIGDGSMLFAVQSLVAVSKKFLEGSQPPNDLDLAEMLGCSTVLLKPVLDKLEKGGIIVRGDSRERPITLMRNLDKIGLVEVNELVAGAGAEVKTPKELARLFNLAADEERIKTATVADLLS